LQAQNIEDGRLDGWHLFIFVMLQQLKDASANARWHAQNDALRDAIDGIRLAIIGSIEQMIRCLLKLQGNEGKLNSIL